ncbi:hypothetical protein Ctob_004739 [Chrysochromulina tobinii]|jgi:hypothetical protein|uniref:Uncharacterized protein n=1 Tax=Chrysochromulina tobinii TaxID=1460289 RepID=A0A0M0JA47_9EUKA|nr:hypothetical protein Ctob_004739 [Chrysochromulina tobinii]|eukprot:KOO23237.1 hypothetical protein Ctob_004739 [Chrysochromulina sp. CCMP291]
MFATTPSDKKVTEHDPAVKEAVRYCMIALPAEDGKEFPMMVDGHKMTFTPPKGAKKGQEVEFAFTYSGGQVLSPPYTIDADLESTPSTMVAMAEDEPVLKSSVKSSEPIAYELANAMTSKVLEQHAISAEARISDAVAEDVSPKLIEGSSSAKTAAVETTVNDAAFAVVVEEPAKLPLVAMAEDEPILKSSAKSSEPIDYKELAKATASNVLDAARCRTLEVPEEPIVAKAEDEPVLKSSAKSSEPIDHKELAKATTSIVLDAARCRTLEVPEEPIVAKAKDEPVVPRLGMRELMIALLLLALAVVIRAEDK